MNLPNQHVGKEFRAESALVLRSNFAHQWQHVGENGGRISVAAFSENVPQFRKDNFFTVDMRPAILK